MPGLRPNLECTMKSTFLASALAALIFASLPLAAQVNTSTLAGLVKDETGSAVPNAKVTATTLATGQQRVTNSNEAASLSCRSWPRAAIGLQ